MLRYDYIYKLDQIYFMEQLLKENESVERYIKRLNEELEEMNKRQLALYKKTQELYTKEYEYSIELRRTERDRIIYEVFYFKTVKGFNASNYHGTSQKLEYYKFSGKERRAAIILAETLAKKYNCKLNKNF